MNKRVRRMLAALLCCCLLVQCGIFTFLPTPSAHADEGSYALNTTIELENTAFASNFTVKENVYASGGKYISDTVSSGNLTDPDGKTPPEISLPFTISTAGVYYVWLRANATGSGSDTFYIGFNNETLNSSPYGTGFPIREDGSFIWVRVKTAALSAGTNTLKLYHREKGLKMDAIYVTSNVLYDPGATAPPPTYALDTKIELEDTPFQENFTVKESVYASGGKYISDTVSSGNLTDPDGKTPEIVLPFTISTAGVYYVWLRANAAGSGSDTFYIGFNNETLNSSPYGTGFPIREDGSFIWVRVKTAALSVGTNALKLYHREKGLKMDAIYVTSNVLYDPGATAPRPTYALDTKIELEDTPFQGNFTVKESVYASGGKYISDTLSSGNLTDPDSKMPEIVLPFEVGTADTYYVWLRGNAERASADSFYIGFNDEALNSALYGTSFPVREDGGFIWVRVKTAALGAGTNAMKLYHREGALKMDALYVTADVLYNPGGDEYVEPVYPMPTQFSPPAAHPRIYFRSADIPGILANSIKPQNANALVKHQTNLLSTVDGSLPATSASTNFSAATLSVIESRAFEYAMRGDAQVGLSAISAMRNFMTTVKFTSGDYNGQGQTVFVAAEVYDWCYPLLTSEDQTLFANFVMSAASLMEIGWPPINQGAVVGHGVEGQLMRDLAAAGIAMYDERPDIFQHTVGRFFAEYIEPKLFMYPAHMHNQGEHYMQYRFQWEILATWLYDRAGHPKVFGPDQQYALYWPLYARRPDGQLLRDGDGSRNNNAVGVYDASFYRSMLLTGNYFGDPYLKEEGMRELPYLKLPSPTSNQSLNPVEFLVFNDPDLGGRPVSELPLTMYYPSPKGGMIARTGWQDGVESPAVVAEMEVNEWWFANHQHLDAGSFQIYYKGALATDSGYYQAALKTVSSQTNNGSTGYGSPHDLDYNKRSIAHNTMLVYDPNETFVRSGNRANDGGQRIPNGGKEPKTLEELQNPANGYRTAEIRGHEYGEDPMKPNYSYLKGDLTQAYSNKISDYERSFMFLNLQDDAHPAAMVVFDRVVSANPEFKKTWLLHGLEEPEITGNRTVFKNERYDYNGKLTVDTMLPQAGDAQIQKIGGPGQEFMVDGVNYDALTIAGGNNEGGGWRMELSPQTAKAEDYFLNVLQVGDASPDTTPLPVSLIETANVAGAVVADRVIVFGKAKGRTSGDVAFSFSGSGSYEMTVADLAAGTWTIQRNGINSGEAIVTEAGGVAVYRGEAGAYTLTYKNANAVRPIIPVEPPVNNEMYIRVNNRFVYSETGAKLQNGELLLPAQPVLSNLGVDWAWDDQADTMTAEKDGHTLSIANGASTAYWDNAPVAMTVAASVYGQTLLVPATVLSDTYFAAISRDTFANVIYVQPGTPPAPAKDYIPITVSTSSGYFEDTTPDKSHDGNVETLWSVEGTNHWVIYDLGAVQTVADMEIVFNKGNERKAYFGIDVSEDGDNWTPVIQNGEGSGLAAFVYETFSFPTNTQARYIRYNAKGNSNSSWNAIIEIKFARPAQVGQ
ncbi:heparin/heparin-sulfate lyase HepB [Paenibacillus sp. FSL H8-0034]|uniref:heparin/heparin-sulfate lyase HepB n=1 Tax=Paenibacillus sp. FSL H8-0034 TaxID=2954671 RepID=UPI0030F706AD